LFGIGLLLSPGSEQYDHSSHDAMEALA
jgi:hypothetical protein